MITIANKPMYQNPTANERMGDPTPYDQDPRLVTLLFPYPQGPTTTYASWPIGAASWQAKETIDDSCLFQRSKTVNTLEGERGGPLVWVISGDGLF